MSTCFFPLLHRCIFKELLQNCSLSLITLLTFLLIGRGLQIQDLLLNLDLSFVDIGLLFLYMMPAFMILVLPISCMLSVFLTFLRMSSDRELIAAKAAGISLFQMVRSPFVFSLLCMICAFFISLHGISWGMDNFRSLVLQIADTKAKVVIQPGIFNQDLFGKTLYAKAVDTHTGVLQDVLFEDKTTDGKSVITFIAPEGVIYTDEEKGEIQFSLKNGTIYQFSGDKLSVVNFKQYVATLDLSKLLSGFALEEIKAKEMSWQQLLHLDRTQSADSEWHQRKVSVEIHKRLALPFACLALSFFAMVVACSFVGVRQQFGVLVALGLFLVYYSLFSLGSSLVETGTLNPAIALWFPNALFAVAAAIGLYYVNQEKTPWMQLFAYIRLPRKITRRNK